MRRILVKLGLKKAPVPVAPTLDQRLADAIWAATNAVDMFSAADRKLTQANVNLLAIRDEVIEQMANLQQLKDSTTKQFDQNSNLRIKLQDFINPK